MSKKNLNSKTKWSLIGGGVVLAASLAIGLGVHFGTQSESGPSFNERLDVFVSEMAKVSEDNINTENKETIINDKEYELIEKHKVFCGGTDQAGAQKKLKTFHDAHQEKQTFFIKPHSIVSTNGTKKTFSNYREETNVEKNCWDVEVPEFPTGTRAHPTEVEGRVVATIRFNIDKNREVDKNLDETRSNNLQLIIDSGIYCSDQDVSFGQAADYISIVLSNYELISGDTLAAPLTFTGDYGYVKGKVISVRMNCWRAVPKTTEGTE